MTKGGTRAIKIGLSFIAFIFAAGLAGKLSKGILDLNDAVPSIEYIFIISMIIPIWYSAPIWRRVAAAVVAIVAGLATWAVSYVVFLAQWPDPTLAALVIYGFRATAILVSYIVCTLMLRFGLRGAGYSL